MSKFRKRPVVIEAVRWDGTIPTWEILGEMMIGAEEVIFYNSDHTLDVPTNHGRTVANVGDWIIKTDAGEFYPCKNDIFVATYEPVAE